MRIRRILWPTDFSECATAALDHAVRMASWHHAALELLHVTVLGDEDPFRPPDRLPDRRSIHRRLRRVPAKEAPRQVAAHASAPIEVRRHQLRAHAAAAEILRFTTEKAVDLVVIGGHGQSGFRRAFLGSVAEEVVRLAACPVLTVREPPGAHSNSIVVPIDFSEHSATALRAARGLASVNTGRLDLIHVVEPLSGPRDPGTRGEFVPPEGGQRNTVPEGGQRNTVPEGGQRNTVPGGRRALAGVADRLAEFADEVLGRPRVEYRVEVIEGIAAASITAHAANTRAELIVIATHGLTGQRHFLLDTVTEKVVRTATCPVLTIKGPHAPDAHEGAAAGLA